MKILFRYSAAAIILAIFFTGCSYNPGPNSTGPGKTIPGKAGSTYTFKNVQTDTTGKPIDSTLYYTRDSIAEAGTTYSGKTNVSHIISIDVTTGYQTGDTYINFETNGDISVYSGSAGGFPGITLPQWETYPVQSHGTSGEKVADTNVTLPGVPLPVHVVAYDSLFYVNSNTFTVGSNNIPVYNGKQVISYTLSALLLNLNANTTAHLAFAPSLGYIVSQIVDPTISPTSLYPSQGGSQTTLTAYVLK